jgi:hypothetical protein
MKKRNTWILVGVTILAIIIVSANFSELKKFASDKISITNNTGDNNYVFSETNTCPEGIIPEYIYLANYHDGLWGFRNYTSSYYGEQATSVYDLYWADGQKSDLVGNHQKSLCRQGNLEGENINLVYCNNLEYSKTTTDISEDGTIGKTHTISYSIDLVLQMESTRTLHDASGGYYSINKYKVISSLCN